MDRLTISNTPDTAEIESHIWPKEPMARLAILTVRMEGPIAVVSTALYDGRVLDEEAIDRLFRRL